MNLFWTSVILWSVIAIVGGTIFFYIRYRNAKKQLSDSITDLSDDEQRKAYEKLNNEHLGQVGIVFGGLFVIILVPLLFVALITMLIGSCFAMFGL